jgi:hypothetical protein
MTTTKTYDESLRLTAEARVAMQSRQAG